MPRYDDDTGGMVTACHVHFLIKRLRQWRVIIGQWYGAAECTLIAIVIPFRISGLRIAEFARSCSGYNFHGLSAAGCASPSYFIRNLFSPGFCRRQKEGKKKNAKTCASCDSIRSVVKWSAQRFSLYHFDKKQASQRWRVGSVKISVLFWTWTFRNSRHNERRPANSVRFMRQSHRKLDLPKIRTTR